MRRREFAIATGSIVTGLVGSTLLFTNETSAATVSVDGLNISGDTLSSNKPVASVRLDLSGEYQYDCTTTPSKGVIRLYVSANNETQQLAAKALDTPLKATQSDSYSFENVNLLDHQRLNAPGLSPTEIGETVSQSVTITVMLQIYDKGRLLEETSISDSAMLEVTKTKATVDITLGGSGSIDIKPTD